MASIVSQLRNGLPDRPIDKSRQIQVIGSGMGRTGTMSLSAALERLLDGKVYHTGTMVFYEETTMKTWGQILDPSTPPSTTKPLLSSLLSGYVGITDTWGAAMTPELLELYPEAVVIVTTRDPEAWWKSWSDMTSNAPPAWTMKVMLAPVPIFRYFPGSIRMLWKRLSGHYGFERVREPQNKDFITIHNEWLKHIVPPERLHFFSVKEGWEPLCKILNVPVPDEPFPRANEQAAMTELGERIMGKVKARWSAIFGAIAVGVAGVLIWIRHLKER